MGFTPTHSHIRETPWPVFQDGLTIGINMSAFLGFLRDLLQPGGSGLSLSARIAAKYGTILRSHEQTCVTVFSSSYRVLCGHQNCLLT